MIGPFLVGLVVAALATVIALAVVWARWRWRLHRRRRLREQARAANRRDLERAIRRLRLRVTPL